MKRRTLIFTALPLALVVATASPAASEGGLTISTARAPIVPDGTSAGADPDFVVTFADPDPDVPGVDIHAGGTISLRLPDEMAVDDPSAPLTGVVLQGWPQSPRLPFPTLTYEAATHTVIGTLAVDYFAESRENPGPKAFHVILPGFTNPRRGHYDIGVTIQPDPNDPFTISGEGDLRIIKKVRRSINAINVINGSPPPPFPNSIHQHVAPGETPLLWGFYVWDRDGVPYLGVDLEQRNRRRYDIVDEHGDRIGKVRIFAPPGARDYSIEANASVPANAAVLGVPTGLLTAQFHPDPDVKGTYEIRWRLRQGNQQWMSVEVVSP